MTDRALFECTTCTAVHTSALAASECCDPHWDRTYD